MHARKHIIKRSRLIRDWRAPHQYTSIPKGALGIRKIYIIYIYKSIAPTNYPTVIMRNYSVRRVSHKQTRKYRYDTDWTKIINDYYGWEIPSYFSKNYEIIDNYRIFKTCFDNYLFINIKNYMNVISSLHTSTIIIPFKKYRPLSQLLPHPA